MQSVIRPNAAQHHDYRGYADQVAGGVCRAGDEVVVLPSGRRTRVAAVETLERELDAARPPQSVTIRLKHDVDVGRGDTLADPERPPVVARELRASVCWMSERPLEPRARLLVKHTTRTVQALVDELFWSSTWAHSTIGSRRGAELYDLGVARLGLAEPLAVDPYLRNAATGSFILIDEASNDTVGAGMVVEAS